MWATCLLLHRLVKKFFLKKKKKKKKEKENGLEIEACRAAPDPVPQNLTEEPFSGSKALALMRGLVHGWLMENVKGEVKRK